MSDTLAIGAVTAVLKNLLETSSFKSLVDSAVGTFSVSTRPPDTFAEDNENRINLFLYQAVENAGLRNQWIPSRNSSGERIENAPLALDIQYLVTAYGKEDYYPEIMLGYAMHVFHEIPVLPRDQIRKALSSSTAGGSWPAGLEDSGLADQLEQIKITPRSLGAEELSRLWAGLQTPYRPTSLYQVTVVLLQASSATRRSLPVLTIGKDDQGVVAVPGLVPPYPALTDWSAESNQESIRLGEKLTLKGHHLDGSNMVVRFEHGSLDEAIEIDPESQSAETVTVVVPNLPAEWPAGFYRVSVSVRKSGETYLRTTNSQSVSLAPRITSVSATRDVIDPEQIHVVVNFSPEVWTDQDVSLTLGSQEVPHEGVSANTGTLTFDFTTLEAGSDYWVRLRVDGVDSLLIDRSGQIPMFDLSQKVSVH